jgi:hypothetical protein
LRTCIHSPPEADKQIKQIKHSRLSRCYYSSIAVLLGLSFRQSSVRTTESPKVATLEGTDHG